MPYAESGSLLEALLKKQKNKDEAKRILKMNEGGIGDPKKTPEAQADVTRNPVMRELFDEVVQSARTSPEFEKYRRAMELAKTEYDFFGNVVGNERTKRELAQKAARRLKAADVAGLRGTGSINFDRNLAGVGYAENKRLANPDGTFSYRNFTELVKAGDEDAMRTLSKMNDLYNEKYRGPQRFPVFRMFGVEPLDR